MIQTETGREIGWGETPFRPTCDPMETRLRLVFGMIIAIRDTTTTIGRTINKPLHRHHHHHHHHRQNRHNDRHHNHHLHHLQSLLPLLHLHPVHMNDIKMIEERNERYDVMLRSQQYKKMNQERIREANQCYACILLSIE